MAHSLIGQNGKPVYGLKNYILDTKEDLKDLTIADTIGSTAFVIEESKMYVLNNNREWVPTSMSGGSGNNTIVQGEDYESIPFSEIDSFFEEE